MRPACSDRTQEMFPAYGELRRVWLKRASVLIEQLCSTCPMRSDCYDMGKDEGHGIWGGTTEKDRGFQFDGFRRESRKK